MSALALTIVAYAVALAAILALHAVRGVERGPRVNAALALVQVATTLLVVVDGVSRARELNGSALGTHVGYLVTAVIVLPVSFTVAGTDRGRWGNAAMSFACLLLAVVVVRLLQTDGARG